MENCFIVDKSTAQNSEARVHFLLGWTFCREVSAMAVDAVNPFESTSFTEIRVFCKTENILSKNETDSGRSR